ncbi:hypothetical protein BZA77DRAFT_323861 [Pyronema omphalodes]|nr:hypothetical protein BZA77DRAFT_323861 [Pyronema omphalodes]
MDDWGSPWADDADRDDIPNPAPRPTFDTFSSATNLDVDANHVGSFQSATKNPLVDVPKVENLPNDPWAGFGDDAAWGDSQSTAIHEDVFPDWTDSKPAISGATNAAEDIWTAPTIDTTHTTQIVSPVVAFNHWDSGENWGDAGSIHEEEPKLQLSETAGLDLSPLPVPQTSDKVVPTTSNKEIEIDVHNVEELQQTDFQLQPEKPDSEVLVVDVVEAVKEAVRVNESVDKSVEEPVEVKDDGEPESDGVETQSKPVIEPEILVEKDTSDKPPVRDQDSLRDELSLDQPQAANVNSPNPSEKQDDDNHDSHETHDEPETSSARSEAKEETNVDASATNSPEASVPTALDATANTHNEDPTSADIDNADNDFDDDFGDFGDFAEEADFDDFVDQAPPPAPQSPTTPVTPIAPKDVPAFDIDVSLVKRLYPTPSDLPELPAVEKDVLGTVEARKVWYRLSQGGTLRKLKAEDEDTYIRITWSGSKVQGEVHKVVARWAAENKFKTPGMGGVKTPQNLGAMFGWGGASSNSPQEPAKKRMTMASVNRPLPPPLQSHTRHLSESSSGPRTPALPPPVDQAPTAASARPSLSTPPLTPTLSWPSSSNQAPSIKGFEGVDSNKQSPAHKKSDSISSIAHSAVLSSASSAVASNRSSLVLEKAQSSPVALPPVSPSKAASSNASIMASRSSPTPVKPIDEPKPVQYDPREFEGWATFDTLDVKPAPSSNTTAKATDNWGTFEDLVAPNKASSSTNPLALAPTFTTNSLKSDDGWGSFDTFAAAQSTPQSLKSPVKESISTDTLGKYSTPLQPSPPRHASKPSITSIWGAPKASLPAAVPVQQSHAPLSVSTSTEPTQPEDDDDEWGEMQSPTKDTSFTFAPPAAATPISDPFAGLSGFGSGAAVGTFGPRTSTPALSSIGTFGTKTITPTAPPRRGSVFDILQPTQAAPPSRTSTPQSSTQPTHNFNGMDIFASQQPLPVSRTVTPAASAAPTQSSQAFAGLDIFGTNSSRSQTPSSSVTPVTQTSNSADNWDLSFFEKPAPKVQVQSQSATPRGSSDVWRQPAVSVLPMDKRDTADDKTIQKIIDGLPDLSYMLA